ncbi:MAG: zinc ribbon domain-containing protein [Lentisphaeria bacterium]|nr:zinc ribbon domain-containing protein [Lentisphaeria bacterium]NQZ69550.1 zinc ribbon domain-containing protein [Lentisphaeria bacterium]
MPTYEYKCKTCDHRLEAFQSMTDDRLTDCPDCGGPLKRLIGSGAGIIFKGSGFYETDYKRKSSDKEPSKGGEKESSKNNDKGSSEKKPETKKVESESPKKNKSDA